MSVVMDPCEGLSVWCAIKVCVEQDDMRKGGSGYMWTDEGIIQKQSFRCENVAIPVPSFRPWTQGYSRERC